MHQRETREGEWLLAGADGNGEEAVQPLIAAFLVGLHVACGMECHGPARAPICVHAKRCLLGHGPGGKEQRSLLAEHRRDLLLELGDDATEAVVVDLGVRWDQREELIGGAASVAEEESRADSATASNFASRENAGGVFVVALCCVWSGRLACSDDTRSPLRAKSA